MSTRFTVHEITTPQALVREYAAPSGVVFAVSWNGPRMPDLRQTLGTYFPQFLNAPRPAHPNHAHFAIQQSNLVVQSSAHMRRSDGPMTRRCCLRMCPQPIFNSEGAMRTLNLVVLPALIAALLADAAGGDGSDFGGSSGGTSGTGGNTITTSGSNVAPMSINIGPANETVNTGFVSVTVCVPGTSTCATINGVEVDTGSYGLRLLASALPSGFTLPQENDASSNPVVECTVFADGISWGPVVSASITISGESTAQAVPVQIIGSSNFSTPPSSCSSRATEDDLTSFGANGIIGVGPFVQDTGDYYTCPGGLCAESTVTSDLEVSNPVAFFPVDNNGVIVELPSVGASGADTLSGSLVFGIGTESNNGLGTAAIYGVDPTPATSASPIMARPFRRASSTAARMPITSSMPPYRSAATARARPASSARPRRFLNRPRSRAPTARARRLISASPMPFRSSATTPNGIAFVNLAAPETDTQSFDFRLAVLLRPQRIHGHQRGEHAGR